MGNAFRIGVNAFLESLREPVYVLVLLASLGVIYLYPATADFVFYEEQKFVTDGAMATLWFGALLATTLAAGNAVSRELRGGSALFLLSKPVSRFSYLAGKISGVAAAGLFFGVAASCATLTALSIATNPFHYDGMLVAYSFGTLILAAFFGCAANFLKGVSFPEYASLGAGALTVLWCVVRLTTARELPFSPVEAVKALGTLLGAVAVLGVLAAAVAFRFDLVPSLGIMLGVFLGGTLSQYLFDRSTGYAAVDFLLRFCRALAPDWQLFWLADAVAMKRTIPWSCFFLGWCDALLYAALVIVWAAFLFGRREVSYGGRDR